MSPGIFVLSQQFVFDFEFSEIHMMMVFLCVNFFTKLLKKAIGKRWIFKKFDVFFCA